MDNFRVVPDARSRLTLQWDDLAVHYGLRPPRAYSAIIETPSGQRLSARLDDASLRLDESVDTLPASPGGDPAERLLELEIQGDLGDFQWTPPVHVTVYVPIDGSPRVVRIIRDD
jgi:hypothetical protein